MAFSESPNEPYIYLAAPYEQPKQNKSKPAKVNMEPRLLENAVKVVELAKLDPKSLVPMSQALYFDTDNQMDQDGDHGAQICLLEVTPEVADQIEKGDEFVFRGDPNDSVILCSKNGVFDIKEAETSNSILLVQGLRKADQCQEVINEEEAHKVIVLKTFFKYFEMKPAKPAFQRLFALLEERTLTSSVKDDEASWTFQQLLDRVQCSENELKEGLVLGGAVQLDHHRWTLIDQDMKMRILSMICNVVNSNSWSWNRIPKDELLREVTEIESEVIASQIFEQFFKDGKADRFKVCRFYGEYLLQSSTVFNLNEFFHIWQDSLPVVDNEGEEPFKADLSQLEGIALVMDNDQIKYFPETKLPANIQERLSLLFATKEKWSLQEINPFVTNLTTAKLNVKALLTKYARGCKVNGQQMFCSKHQH